MKYWWTQLCIGTLQILGKMCTIQRTLLILNNTEGGAVFDIHVKENVLVEPQDHSNCWLVSRISVNFQDFWVIQRQAVSYSLFYRFLNTLNRVIACLFLWNCSATPMSFACDRVWHTEVSKHVHTCGSSSRFLRKPKNLDTLLMRCKARYEPSLWTFSTSWQSELITQPFLLVFESLLHPIQSFLFLLQLRLIKVQLMSLWQ